MSSTEIYRLSTYFLKSARKRSGPVMVHLAEQASMLEVDDAFPAYITAENRLALASYALFGVYSLAELELQPNGNRNVDLAIDLAVEDGNESRDTLVGSEASSPVLRVA